MGDTEITVKEAAKITKYTTRHIRRLAEQGTVKARLIGERLYLISKDSLLDYVAKMESLGNGKHAQ